MRRFSRITVIAALLALAPALSACESFDMDKLDVFGLGTKKKLPGERQPVFPSGVPGVTQGVPPDLVKGSQAQQQQLDPLRPAPAGDAQAATNSPPPPGAASQ